MSRKIIAVVGATGAQGGGLVRALLAAKNDELGVRAVTRKPDSDKAKALAALGAEVVAADLDDAASLRQAFAGADGAFCVTNYWESMSPDKELAQAKNLAEASQASDVKHVVWSTLEDTRVRVPVTDQRMPTLQGRFKVPHFDVKGEADKFFDPARTTWLLTTFYWDNLLHFGMGPKRSQDGKLTFALPMGDRKLAGIASEDIGKCALGIFKRGAPAIGKRIGISGDQLTGEQMAAELARALEQPVSYQALPPAVYRSFGFPGADDLGNMFQYYAEFDSEFCAVRSVSESRALNPELQSFSQWLAKNKAHIPLG